MSAQDSAAIHQLLTAIATAGVNTAKVWLYNDLLVAYREYDNAAAMQAINQGIKLSHSIILKGKSQLRLNKGTFLNLNDENTAAETMYKPVQTFGWVVVVTGIVCRIFSKHHWLLERW